MHETEPMLSLLRRRNNRTKSSFAILEASPGIIGRLFKELLSDAKAFPLIISGNPWQSDHTVVLFVLLLILDVPAHSIKYIDTCIMEDVVHDSRCHPENVQKIANQRAKEESWVPDMIQWLNLRYGGIEAFFAVAGIAEGMRNRVQGILLHDQTTSEKTLIDMS